VWSALLRVDLGELPTAPVGVEPAQEYVVVRARALLVFVAAGTDRDGPVAIERPGVVLGRPRPGLVAVGTPVVDDGGPSPERLFPRVVAVLGVLAGQVPDRRRIVALPCIDVGIEPATR